MSTRMFRTCYPIWIASAITVFLNPVVMIIASMTGGIFDSPVADWWLQPRHFTAVLAAVWLPFLTWAVMNWRSYRP